MARLALVRKVHPEDAVEQRGGQLEIRRLLDLFRDGARQEIRDVDFALLQRGGARRLLGDRPEDQAFHVRRLPPVAVEGLDHQLDARVEGDEAIRAGTDGRALEAVLADFLHVFLRHDPSATGRHGSVEREEIGPGLLQPEPDVTGIDGQHLAHLVLEDLRARAAVALERELHVLGRDRLAVMELRALADDEVVREPVLRRRPRLGEAWRERTRRHRLHHRVVQCPEDHERRGDSLGVRRIEEPRRDRDVDTVGDLAFGRGLGDGHGAGGRRRHGQREGEGREDEHRGSNVDGHRDRPPVQSPRSVPERSDVFRHLA